MGCSSRGAGLVAKGMVQKYDNHRNQAAQWSIAVEYDFIHVLGTEKQIKGRITRPKRMAIPESLGPSKCKAWLSTSRIEARYLQHEIACLNVAPTPKIYLLDLDRLLVGDLRELTG